MLDAQRTLLAAETLRIAAARDSRLSIVDFAKALGGGWEPRDLHRRVLTLRGGHAPDVAQPARVSSGQRLLDVGDEVVDVLDADRQAHESAGRAFPAFDARAVLREALDRSQRCRALEHPSRAVNAFAASSPPATRSDIIPPKPPFICFAATACPGCDGKPG